MILSGYNANRISEKGVVHPIYLSLIHISRAQFTAEGGYYLKFLSDPTKTVFLSVGGSALAGYETVNWGERILYDGSRLLAKDAFVYGGAITLELEAYVDVYKRQRFSRPS